MHEFAIVLAPGEPNCTACFGKQRVITAASNILTRVEFGTALTDNNGSGLNEFTTEGFYTEHLGVGVATILGGPHSFLMCHSGPRWFDYSASAGAAASAAFGSAFFLAAAFLILPTESIFICVYG
jgi:hypothetical protein